MREEAKRRKVVEEKKKKKRMLEYIQQLQNEVLEKEVALFEDTEESQIIGLKYKEIPLEDDVDHQPFKKTKEKQPARYQGDIGVKMGGTNLWERCVYTRQSCPIYNLR